MDFVKNNSISLVNDLDNYKNFVISKYDNFFKSKYYSFCNFDFLMDFIGHLDNSVQLFNKIINHFDLKVVNKPIFDLSALYDFIYWSDVKEDFVDPYILLGLFAHYASDIDEHGVFYAQNFLTIFGLNESENFENNQKIFDFFNDNFNYLLLLKWSIIDDFISLLHEMNKDK